MNKKLLRLTAFLVLISLTGCATAKGALQDAGNAARNIADIFRAGEAIGGAVGD